MFDIRELHYEKVSITVKVNVHEAYSFFHQNCLDILCFGLWLGDHSQESIVHTLLYSKILLKTACQWTTETSITDKILVEPFCHIWVNCNSCVFVLTCAHTKTSTSQLYKESLIVHTSINRKSMLSIVIAVVYYLWKIWWKSQLFTGQ